MGATWRLHGEYRFREEHETWDDTYAQAIVECLASDGQRPEELGNGLAACLRIARSSSWRTLSRSEVGDTLGGGDGDVGPSHGVGNNTDECLNWKNVIIDT